MIKNFEKSLAELEKLVTTLEKGELSLEQSLNQFEKGIQISKKCQQALSLAEQKVEKLTKESTLESLQLDDD